MQVSGGRSTKLSPTLIPIVVTMCGSEKDIIVTGHSRGGALAELLATLLWVNNYQASVVTFGAPAVGDATFVNTFRGSGEQLSEWTTYIPGPIAYVMTVVGTACFLIWWFVTAYSAQLLRRQLRRRRAEAKSADAG
jgi:hypothetical protein